MINQINQSIFFFFNSYFSDEFDEREDLEGEEGTDEGVTTGGADITLILVGGEEWSGSGAPEASWGHDLVISGGEGVKNHHIHLHQRHPFIRNSEMVELVITILRQFVAF